MLMLAATDNGAVPGWLLPTVVIGMIVQFSFNGVVAWALHRSKQVREDLRNLEGKLHETATKLVDERFRAMSHEVNNHVNAFVLTLDAMKERLGDGEDTIDGLRDRDQKIELLVASRCEMMKDAIRDTTASKEDFRRHEAKVDSKFEYTDRRIGEVREMLAAISERMGVKPRGGSRG